MGVFRPSNTRWTSMYLFRFRFFALALVLPTLFLRLPSRALAQASTAASKTQDISVFAGVEFANPQYGPNNNAGVAFGADFTRYFRFPVQPSLEVRANLNRGTYANESSFLFGLRGAYQYRFLTPYVDFLVGPGSIHYPLNQFYTGDNSIVYNYGIGVDVDFMRNLSLKLDLQQQRWNTGTFAFKPVLGVIGITYHIPFKPKKSGYGRY